MGEAICLFNLPREIWRSRIIPRLSVEDACRLDSALLNHILRPSLLEVFVDAKLEKETVVSLDIIDWITSRKIQPLRIKLIEDITGEDLSMFLDYCTELVSLNTWDFQVDAQVALKKSRQNDDNTLTYDGEFCEFSEEFVIAILKSSTHLKSLSICDMSLLQWFRMFPNIVHLCGNMEEINFRERQEAEREGAELTEYDEFEYSCFYLSRTSLHMVSNEIIPSALLAAVGAHFSTLTSVSILTTSMNAYIDKGLLSLAAHCPALERAALGEAYSHGTIVEFCRRRPNLTELRLIGDLTFFPETLQRALQLLPGTGTHPLANNYCVMSECCYEY